MIATKERKAEQVAALVGRLKRSPTIYLTDFTGLDVARLTDLRRKLRAAGVEYVVVKNTLARRAFGEARVAGLDAHLQGPTGLVLAGTDPVTAARVLTDFAKEHTTLAVKVGLVEGKAIAPDQVTRLAHLPSKGAAGPAGGRVPGAARGPARSDERTADDDGGCPRGAQGPARVERGLLTG